MIFSLNELFDMIVIIVFVGIIFKDFFRKPAQMSYERDPVAYYRNIRYGINWHDFVFAAMVTAPAIILHEFGHKFVAMSFGLEATFHAAYMWLGLGLLLKLMKFGFIFFVPAFVSYPALATPLQNSFIAFAGPGVNLLLWLGSWLALKQNLVKSRKWITVLALTSKINMFLFFFNMIPIPPFDGFHVFAGLAGLLF